MNKIRNYFLRESQRIEQWITETENSLRNAPEGSLKIRHPHGYTRYYQKTAGGREKYLSKKKDAALIHALAQKSYDIKLLYFLKAAIAAMQLFLTLYPDQTMDDIFHALSPQRRELVRPLRPTAEQFLQNWLSKPYTPKGFFPGDATAFYTKKGLRVRSKSELIIAELLDELGIPYKYECPLLLKNGITIYPDFTILDLKKRCEVYLEHCGMLGDQKYAADFVDRMGLYTDNEIYQGEHLILTFETGDRSIDTRSLRKMLRHRFCAA